VYLALWIYGLVIERDSEANCMPVNNADNWLHLILGIGVVSLALLLSRDTHRTGRAATRR
jgi:hypothetical protein